MIVWSQGMRDAKGRVVITRGFLHFECWLVGAPETAWRFRLAQRW